MSRERNVTVPQGSFREWWIRNVTAKFKDVEQYWSTRKAYPGDIRYHLYHVAPRRRRSAKKK